MNSLSELRYRSIMIYSSYRGYDEIPKIVEQGKDFIKRIKRDNKQSIARLSNYLSSELQDEEFLSIFNNKKTVLVPVPKSSKTVKNGLFPTLSICNSFVSHGLALKVANMLTRETTIEKSSTSLKRPSLNEHLNSLRLSGELESHELENIILVDDVITKGTTSFACATTIKDAYPNARVELFSVARTIGFKAIEEPMSIFVGSVKFKHGMVMRSD